jgi:hypothetical protein
MTTMLTDSLKKLTPCRQHVALVRTEPNQVPMKTGRSSTVGSEHLTHGVARDFEVINRAINYMCVRIKITHIMMKVNNSPDFEVINRAINYMYARIKITHIYDETE